MGEYIVSARKYRPMTFDSVVGQQALTTTLKNTIKSGKLAHSYLFCGPRGVGKTTCARIFAKAINCTNLTPDGEACNECESCKAFNEGRSLNIFELDAASNNSVQDIRDLILQTRVPPQSGRYKVFIIDEVHMLSQAAFNAFLKTLEEPPAHVIFILATTEKQKILPTILSRCQIYDFERMTVQGTVDHLKHVAEKEGIAYEEAALTLIAEKADGGMRDALSIFDQAASFCQGNITYQKVLEDLNVLDEDNYFKMVELALKNNVPELMVTLNNIINKGFDGGRIINGLAAHMRNVLMAKNPETLPLLETSDSQRQRFQQQAQNCPTSFLYKALEIANRCDVNYRNSSNKRLLVELTLIEIAQITQPDDTAAGAGRSPKRLKNLFKKIASQVKPVPQVAGANKPGSTIETTTKPAPKSVVNVNMATQPVANESKKPVFKLGNIGMTFNDLRRNAQEKKQTIAPQVTNKGESDDFNEEQLAFQWLSMCNRMPKEMVGMAQRMKNMTPHITEFPNVEVVVENEILLHQMEGIKARILATLAKELHNANIHFSLRLAEANEIKKVLNKRELFDQMRKENPAVEALRKGLELELA
ncbi:MAG: DNA polymerase III subunit gamma/tau [Prevotella sp.]|nr:DNA polymerase III subunit gamma/tau [Prevotella sp.]